MFELLANGPGPPYPTSLTTPSDWLVWGGCLTLAALLSGWAILNLNRSKRFTLAGLALLAALVLGAFATLFVMVQAMYRSDERYRQQQQEGERIEHLKREAEERSQP